jgi:hypothetical protein
LVEVIADLLHWLRVEFIEGLAAGADTAYDADALQHAEVFGDGLPGETRAFG